MLNTSSLTAQQFKGGADIGQKTRLADAVLQRGEKSKKIAFCSIFLLTEAESGGKILEGAEVVLPFLTLGSELGPAFGGL